MTDHVPDTHQSVPATGPLALKSNLVLGPNAQLVERLREWASEPACYEVPPPQLLLDAANEIDRLNAWAVAYYKEMRAALKKANSQAEAFERGWYLRGDALEVAVRQNEHDMLMTGDELRACRAALAGLGA